MQISEISGNKIKITLTDTEVLCCFSSYQKLFSMSAKTKNTIKILIGDIIYSHYGILGCDKICAEIRGKENTGCVIILSCEAEIKNCKDYILCFKNSEEMIKSSLMLNRLLKKQRTFSSLYKNEKQYFLIINTLLDKKTLSKIREFFNIQCDTVKSEYIKEYCNLITEQNAIKKISLAFSKRL